MTQDDFNTLAWRDFIVWAWKDPDMRAQFTKQTGVQIQSKRTAINAVIDNGVGKSVPLRFIEWATREHWGIESAPLAYQKAIAGKEARSQ